MTIQFIFCYQNSVKLYMDKINNYENNKKKKVENVDVKPIDFKATKYT